MDKTISFRSQLSGDLNDLLVDEGMECAPTGQALVELVVSLSSYREEGVRLFPKVLVCDDLAQLRSLLQSGESIEIGHGLRGQDTMRQALKRCAPLARDGWSIYVHRREDRFHFGVLREPPSPVSLDIRDSVAGLEDGVPVLIASQLGNKTVEVLGGRGARLVIHLSAVRTNQPSPREAVENLAAAVCRGCSSSDGLQEAVESFLRTTLSASLQRGHGALVAVLTPQGRLPDEWADEDGRVDGVQLVESIDLADAVATYRSAETAESHARLLSLAQLLEGMLSADGITLFGCDGTVHGYNFFVKTPESDGALPSTMIGGARRRAFRTLEGLVSQAKLAAAFFRSSDGNAEFVGG